MQSVLITYALSFACKVFLYGTSPQAEPLINSTVVRGWCTDAFRWHPTSTPLPAEHTPPDTALPSSQDTTRQAVVWMPNPVKLWEELWEHNPEGSFLFDFWIPAMLAAAVVVISCVSIMYTVSKSRHALGAGLTRMRT